MKAVVIGAKSLPTSRRSKRATRYVLLEGHTAGGEAGRVYVYGGAEPDYSTEDGERIEGKTWRVVARGDVIRVAGNHMKISTFGPPKESGLEGKLYRYKGDSARLDISSEDFAKNTGAWEELATEESVALWKEDYSNSDRWRLAEGFGNPSKQAALTQALVKAGIELPTTDGIRSSALYRSDDGLSWDYSTADGTVTVNKDEVVGVASGKDAGTLYRFKGADDNSSADTAALNELEVDLSKEDFSDTDRWEKVNQKIRWLMRGDTVRVTDDHRGGGEAGRVYRYIGPSNSLFTDNEDYGDEARWLRLETALNVSVIEEGLRWKIVDALGKSYTLSFNAPPAGSSALPTAVISRNSINAVSVAASAAVGLSASGPAVAVSGAGAVAVNSISGFTDAVLRSSIARAEEGNVALYASSEKAISATITAVSVALAASATDGIGASIGVAVARNLIGKEGFGAVGDNAIATVRALVIDSDVETGGVLDLRADARSIIDVLVVSGSAAVAGVVTAVLR